jgi:hypothetical protein
MRELSMRGTLIPVRCKRLLCRVSSNKPADGSPVDQVPLLPSTLAIAVMVFQLRVVTGTPKSRSNVPR